MKSNRYGQAGILSPEQFEELLQDSPPKYRLLWAICYYTSCRISEALQLERSDLVGDRIIFRAKTTKDRKTRDIKISTKLAVIMAQYTLPEKGYLFPGEDGKHMTRQAADLMLRKICDYLGFRGISTHSFRRTSITNLHNAGIPLKHIQKRSGHATLANLARYVEVNQEAVDAAGELLWDGIYKQLDDRSNLKAIEEACRQKLHLSTAELAQKLGTSKGSLYGKERYTRDEQ